MSRRGRVLGMGVYDLLRASYLLGIDDRQLRRWATTDAAGNPPLLAPTHGWAYSFHDLLSLAVIAVLRQRKVSATNVRRTIASLTRMFDYDRPLAHEDVVSALATVGGSVMLPGEGVDVSAHGQVVLLATVETYLRPIEYGGDRLARLWRPADRILVDPEVQVGHPCIERTRITTDVLAGRASQGEPLLTIAADLRVELADVRAAVAFERELREGRGLALLREAA